MVFILSLLLIIISIACFIEGSNDRQGLKLTLSVTLALLLSLIMEVSMQTLLFFDITSGLPLILVYYLLPLIAFSAFQLLLYDIRLFEK